MKPHVRPRTAQPAEDRAEDRADAASSGTAAGRTAEAGPDEQSRPPGLRRKPVVVTAAALAAALALTALTDVLIEHTARERIVRAAECRLRPVGRVHADLSGSLAGLCGY